MFKKRLLGVKVILGTAVLMTACSGNSQTGANDMDKTVGEPVPEAKKEPVELALFYVGGTMGEERFMIMYGDQIVKKYPHISIKYMQSGAGGGTDATSITDAVATKTPIDIIFTSTTRLPADLIAHGLDYDISELAKTHKFDLNQLDPTTLEAIKTIGGGRLLGLPVSIPTSKLIYNRDLFDKFGVPYPKDGMTWDDTFELAKRMTRLDNGVQYLGLVVNIDHLILFNQLSAGFVDPVTKKSMLTDSKWNKLISNTLRFYQIPGMEIATTMKPNAQRDLFGTEGRVAMLAANNSVNDNWPAINWDLAQYPSYPDQPGVGGAPLGNFFGVTSTSQKKDAAFEAISYLTSSEYQIWAARKGFLEGPVNKDPKIRTEYGKEVDYWKNRNIKALIPEKYAAPYKLSPYDSAGPLSGQFSNLIQGKTSDVNTALRLAAEAADKAIEAAIAQGK